MVSALNGPRLAPAAGPAAGPAKQLVVICHGLGADGRDLIALAPEWARTLPHAAFLAPDAPFPCDGAPFGRQWWSVGDRDPHRMEAGVRAAAEWLDATVAAEIDRLGLPGDAYALVGFSQGAMTALFAGLRRMPAPRAILAYSGALIAPHTLAAERRNAAPVLLVHGEADPVVPVAASRAAEAALRAAGIPVTARYTPGLDHTIDAAGIVVGAEALAHAFP